MYVKVKVDLEIDSLVHKETHDLLQDFSGTIDLNFECLNLEYL